MNAQPSKKIYTQGNRITRSRVFPTDVEYVRSDIHRSVEKVLQAFVNGVDEYVHNCPKGKPDEEFQDVFYPLAKAGADLLHKENKDK